MTANVPDSTLVSVVRAAVPDAIVQLSLLGNCTSTVLATCVLPTSSLKCTGNNAGTTTVSASISFYWITPIDLIWRFADSNRGASTDYSQTVTAQCLV
jgi:hypothetical protein